MYCKISMGYGGVELSNKGFNIMTTPQPLSSNDGILFEPEEDKVKQMENITYMYKFLDTICFERVYVEPVQVAMRDFLYDVIFLVNKEYFLHVMMDNNENLYTVLIRQGRKGQEDINTIKFTYEGDILDNFFSEIKKDIKDLFSEQ